MPGNVRGVILPQYRFTYLINVLEVSDKKLSGTECSPANFKKTMLLVLIDVVDCGHVGG